MHVKFMQKLKPNLRKFYTTFFPLSDPKLPIKPNPSPNPN